MADTDLDPDLQRQRIEKLTKRVRDLERKNEQIAERVEELEIWARQLITKLRDQRYDDPPSYPTEEDTGEG